MGLLPAITMIPFPFKKMISNMKTTQTGNYLKQSKDRKYSLTLYRGGSIVSDGGVDRVRNGSVSSLKKRSSNGLGPYSNGGKRSNKGLNGKNKNER